MAGFLARGSSGGSRLKTHDTQALRDDAAPVGSGRLRSASFGSGRRRVSSGRAGHRGSPTPSNSLSARDFGARGDGITDDAAALQRCIDAAQYSRKPMFLPAGIYLVNSTLHVRDNSGTEPLTNCSFCGPPGTCGPGAEFLGCPAPLHLYGEGGWGMQSVIKAGAFMQSVIEVDLGPPDPKTTPRGNPGEGHFFNAFAVDGNAKSMWGLRAMAIVRSTVSEMAFGGAIGTCLELGYGFINRVLDSDFLGCTIGVQSANQVVATATAATVCLPGGHSALRQPVRVFRRTR